MRGYLVFARIHLRARVLIPVAGTAVVVVAAAAFMLMRKK
jgi:hypothetical protein